MLDAGCGIGWSSISLARAFPSLRVDGIDSDEASIAEARRLADEAVVADRVRFEVADAAELGAAGGGGYDAAFVFEALHDMARPVEALQALRALLADGGLVIVADEKVAEPFTAPGDEIERLNFGFSWWHCLPASRAESPSAAAGTALRPSTVRRWARRPGSPSCGSCPSTTCSGGSTSCAADGHVAGRSRSSSGWAARMAMIMSHSPRSGSPGPSEAPGTRAPAPPHADAQRPGQGRPGDQPTEPGPGAGAEVPHLLEAGQQHPGLGGVRAMTTCSRRSAASTVGHRSSGQGTPSDTGSQFTNSRSDGSRPAPAAAAIAAARQAQSSSATRPLP